MRSWSIKTVVVAFSITITLAAAAPRAEAKSTRPSRTHAGVVGRFQQTVSQLLKRFGISTNALPGDPIPSSIVNTETETTTTTTIDPKKIQ